MNQKGKSDIVIIGGKAAGSKVAATLVRRLPDARITLFQKEDQPPYSSCGLPFYASGDISSLEQLTLTPYGVPKTPEFFRQSKGFEATFGAEVTAIDRKNKTVTGRMIKNGNVFDHKYDTLVLATGSVPIKPAFPIADSPQIRTFTTSYDAINFRQLAERGKINKAIIIGGGSIGCELTEAVGGMWGIETIIIEKENQLLPYVLDSEMSRLVERELARQNVKLMLDSEVEKVEVNEDGRPVVSIRGGNKIEADYTFLCMGVRPNTELAEQCGLEIGHTGGIVVNNSMRTSDPDIYAGGDCIESWSQITGKNLYIPMASLASRHGRIIAENIAGDKIEFPGVTGAFLVKIFDINVGAVGLSYRQAQADGLKASEVWGTFVDKPDYYPEARRITVKMVYQDEDDRLLGLQAVGSGDICRRVDVFSSFLQRKAKISDLFGFEYGYAPPFADIVDPLHEMAGIAAAQKRGISFVNPDTDFDDFEQYLDVREIKEAEGTPWPFPGDTRNGDYYNIPFNELRNSLDKLDPEKKTVLICARGSRSYQAALILKNHGFKDVHVIGGGSLAALA
jgi:NADPH-dependent 2,4-dienoyl-CoA reductase/sulfur reductase-like enzyme/rhodanese-related sulfurtransferase